MRNLKVFVYGTLREGRGNHPLLGGAKKIADGAVEGDLFLAGGLPMAVKGDGRIVGELYRVSRETLADLDMLEGHPRWYCREEVNVISYEDENEEPIPHGAATTRVFENQQIAWCYFMTPSGFDRYGVNARKVVNGDFNNPEF